MVRLIGCACLVLIPRLASPPCFGTSQHGHWLVAPTGTVRETRRRYRHNTLVLETEYETDGGSATVVDCMALREGPRSGPSRGNIEFPERGYFMPRSFHQGIHTKEIAMRAGAGVLIAGGRVWMVTRKRR